MQQSKELTPSPEQAAEVTADVTTQARRASARRRKAPVTVPISAALPAEATADLKGRASAARRDGYFREVHTDGDLFAHALRDAPTTALGVRLLRQARYS